MTERYSDGDGDGVLGLSSSLLVVLSEVGFCVMACSLRLWMMAKLSVDLRGLSLD